MRHPCNYMSVILPYHITFAQGGICQHCDKGFCEIPLADSATAGELSFVLDEVDQDVVAEGLMIREKRPPAID